MKKEIVGIIPARGGSKGLPGKNIRLLNGKPLIAHTIEHALKSSYLSRVLVITDCEDIAAIARKYGAETPFKRPHEISGDHSHAFETFKYTIEWLNKEENYFPDYLCCMLATTPFRTHFDISESCRLCIKNADDWFFTINEFEHHPYRAMNINKDNSISPYFNVKKEILWANRQELPEMYRFNGGVVIGKTEHILNHNEYNIDNINFKETKVGYLQMPTERSVDIDTIIDFELAELLLKKGIIDVE